MGDQKTSHPTDLDTRKKMMDAVATGKPLRSDVMQGLVAILFRAELNIERLEDRVSTLEGLSHMYTDRF